MTHNIIKSAFQELNEREQAFLETQTRDVIFQDGAYLVKEGAQHNSIMVIMDGEVRVIKKAPDGQEIELADPMKAGDAIGEMSFIDHMDASATLIAKGDVVVKSIGHDVIQELANDQPDFLQRFYHSILFTIIGRLRNLDRKLVEEHAKS